MTHNEFYDHLINTIKEQAHVNVFKEVQAAYSNLQRPDQIIIERKFVARLQGTGKYKMYDYNGDMLIIPDPVTKNVITTSWISIAVSIVSLVVAVAAVYVACEANNKSSEVTIKESPQIKSFIEEQQKSFDSINKSLQEINSPIQLKELSNKDTTKKKNTSLPTN